MKIVVSILFSLMLGIVLNINAQETVPCQKSKSCETPCGLKEGEKNMTKRVGSLIKVRPEYEERYIILHKHTFPGVLSRIHKSNIRNYSIFLLDGMLFSHFEYVGNDFDGDMKAIADETTREWWKLTDPMQEPLETRKEGEWWAEMELLMCFDKIVKPSPGARRIGLVGEILPNKEEAVREFFKNYPMDIEPDVNKANIQNSNFYFKDGKIYFYYEYVGSDLRNDIVGLIQRNEVFKKSQDDLNNYLVQTGDGPWKVMTEVFHTD
ncbi:MAG: L-rhamnose mutarotase [bacterium]